MPTIIFQGDSVTDAERSRVNIHNEGSGYPTIVKGRLGLESPGKYIFYNKGISGNRISDMYARVKIDIINEAPDYVSFLAGVNDVLHQYIRQNGFSVKRFRQVYIMMLEDIQEVLPETKIFLLEPFILPGRETVSDEEHPGRWEYYSAQVPAYAKAVKEVAERFKIPFVELQKPITESAKIAGPEYILYDGIHPTAAGHELIAGEWLKVFRQIA